MRFGPFPVCLVPLSPSSLVRNVPTSGVLAVVVLFVLVLFCAYRF